MGCDIHAYLEYTSKEAGDSGDYWSGFGGCINPGRNYDLFTLLAGVRGDAKEAVIPPRGIPSDLGCEARNDCFLFVSNDPKGDNVVSRKEAENYHKAYGSAYKKDAKGKIIYVAHPDYHSHTWLTRDEYARVLTQAKLQGDSPYATYTAILAVMDHFENQGYRTRLVLWFDN